MTTDVITKPEITLAPEYEVYGRGEVSKLIGHLVSVTTGNGFREGYTFNPDWTAPTYLTSGTLRQIADLIDKADKKAGI